MLFDVALVGLDLSLLLLDVGSFDKDDVRRDVVDCNVAGTDLTEAGRERLVPVAEPSASFAFCESLLLFSLFALLCDEAEEKGKDDFVGEVPDLAESLVLAVDFAIFDLEPNLNNDRDGDDVVFVFTVSAGDEESALEPFVDGDDSAVMTLIGEDDDGGAAAGEDEDDDDEVDDSDALLDGFGRMLSLDEVRTGTGGLIPDLNGSLLFVFAGVTGVGGVTGAVNGVVGGDSLTISGASSATGDV